MPYNGYPNRASWNVSLWLNNDEGLYRAKQGLVESARSKEDLSTALRAFAYATWPAGVTPDNDKLSECDWEHLASNEWEERADDLSAFVQTPEDETITIEQFISKHGIRFECHRVDSRPDGLMDERPMRHFRCRIITGPLHRATKHYGNEAPEKIGPRSFGLYFSQGSAHTENPTLADVLDCLASDAGGYENARSFDDWAAEYGYDTDSRKAEKTFRAIKRQAEQLKRTIGAEAYEELLYKTERL